MYCHELLWLLHGMHSERARVLSLKMLKGSWPTSVYKSHQCLASGAEKVSLTLLNNVAGPLGGHTYLLLQLQSSRCLQFSWQLSACQLPAMRWYCPAPRVGSAESLGLAKPLWALFSLHWVWSDAWWIALKVQDSWVWQRCGNRQTYCSYVLWRLTWLMQDP